VSDHRETKTFLYEQVARIGKSLGSPKRLELIELLSQGEKCVDQLAVEAGISIKLASAHLKELKGANLVSWRRDGKNMFYRLSDDHVADLWVALRTLAEERFHELRATMITLLSNPRELSPVSGRELLRKARKGEVVVLDVRPLAEYQTAHLPCALSIPLPELKQRISELPGDRMIVAYCRGPFCLMAKEAVGILSQEGFDAVRLEDGVAEWRARGLSLAR